MHMYDKKEREIKMFRGEAKEKQKDTAEKNDKCYVVKTTSESKSNSLFHLVK